MINANAFKLPFKPKSMQMCVTSPPYYSLRKYQGEQKYQFSDWFGAYGLEPTLQMYIDHTVEWCREVKRVLRDDGCFFINLGDSYTSSEVAVSSQKRYNIRNDLSLKEFEDVCMAMFGMRFTGEEKARERIVRQVLSKSKNSQAVRKRPTVEGAGKQKILSEKQGEGAEEAGGAIQKTEMGGNSEAWKSMRVLRGDDTGVFISGSHQQRRCSTPEKNRVPFKFAKNIPGHKKRGVSEGHISSSVHELQLFARLVGILSSHTYKRDEIPSEIKQYFCLRKDNLKPKDLMMVPARVALALQADGWWLRSDIIWHKPNPMPESVTDRPTKSHEYLFLLTKNKKYYYDADAIRESLLPQSIARISQPNFDKQTGGPKDPINGGEGSRNRSARQGLENLKDAHSRGQGRNRRTVWTIATAPYSGAHFATYPPSLIEPCIKAGSKEGDLVLDPFLGSGTTMLVARKLGRIGIGTDLSLEYLGLARERLSLKALDEWEQGKDGETDFDGLPMFT